MMSTKDRVRTLLCWAASNPLLRVSLRGVARAGLLPEGVWKRLPVERTFRVTLGDGSFFKYLSSNGDALGRSLYWRAVGGREAETIRVFSLLAREAELVLDIGANTGIFTLVACAMNPKVRVIAFDPVPHIHRRLEEQIALNGLGDRCQARCEAVSNVLGSVRFHVPHGELPTSASLHAMGFRGVEGSLIDVPVTMIDEVCSDDDHVDLVKIDVEGFEDKVLEGMQRVLAESAPALIVECNPDGPYTAVEAILTRFGYRFFHIRDEGPVQVERIIPDGQERYRNFLCIARDYQGGFE